MTTVADENKISDEDFARVSRVIHDLTERVLKGSLDPNDLVRVLTHLNGKGTRAANLIDYSGRNCPKINWTHPLGPKAKRAKKGASQTCDEAAFFQTRSGLWVDSDLSRYVGLQMRATRGAKALKSPRLLSQNEREDVMFGELGSPEDAQALAKAVDLGQIAELIVAQEGGKSGVLLNNGYANIFPVRGLDGALRVVRVYWRADYRRWFVYCYPFRPDGVWYAGRRAFSN